jgi:hypothetical protein
MKEISEGTIQISRTSQWANSARSIKLFIDDESSRSIKDGEVKSFQVPEGTHKVQAKINWAKTKPVFVKCKKGNTVFLEVSSPLKGWKVHLALFYILMPNRFIYLKLDENT